MRVRATIVVLTLGLIGAGMATVQAAPTTRSVVVGTDPAGDWGSNHDPFIGPLGGPLGQDLLEASIAVTQPRKVDFVLTLDGLPDQDTSDANRYGWRFIVGRTNYLLTNFDTECATETVPPARCQGSFADEPIFEIYTLEPRELVGSVLAQLDRTAGTITISIPAKFIGAKKGSVIAPYSKNDSAPIMASPPVWGSIANNPIPYDLMEVTENFVMP